MYKWLITLCALFALCSNATAQLTVTASSGFGPFSQGQQNQNTFSVAPSDPTTRIDSVVFQITNGSGTSTKTWAQQNGTRTQFTVNMGILPWQPEPQLVVAAYLRQTNGGSKYTASKVVPITISAPQVRYTASDNFAPVRIGLAHTATYTVSQLPANTTEATVSLVDPAGKVVATNTTKGSSLTEASLSYTTTKYPGALRMQAAMRYALEPPGGYTAPQQIIPDSIPAPIVTASAGFGPFRSAVDLQNTFVVRGLGPGCLNVRWALRYITAFGEYRAPLTVTRTYNTAQDSMHFVYNMRDITPGTSLEVTAVFGTFAEQSSSRSYPITVVTSSTTPSYRFNGSLPLIFGTNRLDTVVLDSLPPRITSLTMTLSDGSGTQIDQSVSSTPPGSSTYLRSGKLVFNVKDLPMGSYVLRSTFQNDLLDDPVSLNYIFDVRDTSKVYLVADSWGPYTQGDSSTITPAVTDVRGVTGAAPDRVLGRFALIDTMNPTQPLARSVFVDLSKVTSRDSVIYWPDSTYVFGSSGYSRARIQTVGLPLSTIATFERLIVRGSDTTRDNQVTHEVFVVPSPGVLTSVPPLDTSFIVTRTSNITFTLSSIPSNVSKVRFGVYGMKDLTPVAQQEYGLTPNQTSVSWFTNAGNLPINAKVVVKVITNDNSDNGAEIVRLINTAPDTLSMRSSQRIDTIQLSWNVDPASKLIKGVTPITPTLTFTKIPAQTRSIVLVSRDDRGSVIDSVRVGVSYSTSYQRDSSVSVAFPFRAFNTRTLEVSYVSDGGPRDGVMYTRGVVVIPPVLTATVTKLNTTVVPIRPDPTPIRQASNDVVDLKLLWTPSAAGSGYLAALPIDSVQLKVLDCAGNIIDQRVVRPTSGNAATGVIADTMYPVVHLPLSTTAIEYRLFSSAMTLPADGVVATAPLRLISAPILTIPLGFSYPSYRVTDTLAQTLRQSMYLTKVDGIYEIDSLQFIDRTGRAAITFSPQFPRADTIWFPLYDFNLLNPNNSPYTITGKLRLRTCGVTSDAYDTLGVITVPRVLNDPSSLNWVFSSKGWGPFKQGRAPTTLFVANFDPSAFITTRSEVGDSLAVSIVGVSEDPSIGVFTADVPTRYYYPAGQSLASQARTRASINLTSFDTVSSIALHVRWTSMQRTGARVALDRYYKFPVAMLEFPDQKIYADSTGYEQSVLAGAAGPTVMQDNYNFMLRPESSDITQLKFSFVSSTGSVLDTFSITPDSVNKVDSTSVFRLARDVAQYPWPQIARGRTRVEITFGYQFAGAIKPTKYQKTGISILPRADWLNGTSLSLDGTATPTSVPFKSSIPMPMSVFTLNAPLFNAIQMGIVGQTLTGPTDLVVSATYNPTTKQFTMRGEPSASSQGWNPSVSLFGGLNISSSNVAADNEKKGEFTALYRFERATLGDDSDSSINNRELRVRSLFSSNFSANSGMITFINELAEVIGDIVGDAEDEATGGVVELKPLFSIGGAIKHVSTINIGTEERGTLLHLNESGPPTPSTEPDEFPTSQALGLTLSGGGGLELSFFKGLAGLGATISDQYLLATGLTFSGPINQRSSTFYYPTVNPSVWFNLELSIFWGLIKIDLFRGRLFQEWSPLVMPSFPVFSESWESIFASTERKTGDRTQSVERLAKLPDETPHYRPSPVIDSDTNSLMTVHLEQSGLDNSGKLVLSTLNRQTHSLRSEVVIANNRNAMHNPTITTFGNGGDAFVAWLQNDRDAGKAYGTYSISQLARTENVAAAFYDASTGGVQLLNPVADPSRDLIDGQPSIAASKDTSNAMIAWPALDPDSAFSNVYARRIFKINGVWHFGDARIVSRVAGTDRDVSIAPLDNGSYLVTWINQGVNSSEPHTIYSSVVSEQGATEPTKIATVDAAMVLSDIDMASNGREAMLVYGRTVLEDTTQFNYAIEVFTYRNGTWSAGSSLNVKDLQSKGVIRHIESDVDADGQCLVMVNMVQHSAPGQAESAMSIFSGSVNESPSQWKTQTNGAAFFNEDHAVWSMSASIGPGRVFYLATQELDSVRGNLQTYRNGLPLGPNRFNAVVRAMKVLPNGDVVAVPFGNQPTSVNDDANDAFEQSLRYRVAIMDPAPNPAREACVIPLAVQRPSQVSVKLVDAFGRLIATVYEGSVGVGIQGVSVEVGSIPSGHYKVVLTDELGLVGSVPLVVVH